jgi:hypothetical protein
VNTTCALPLISACCCCLLLLLCQGSGWGWLGYNKASGALDIVTCANQDPLAAKVSPLGVDGWRGGQALLQQQQGRGRHRGGSGS